MASPSILKRKDARSPGRPTADPLTEEAGPVQQARVQARRRLIGAVVLLVIGVIAFPLLFETQPRPLPGAVPIEMPAAKPTPTPTPTPTPMPMPTPTPTPTESAPELPRADAVASAAAGAPPPPATGVAKKDVPPGASPSDPADRSNAKAQVAPGGRGDGERAQALLEGRSTPAASAAAPAAPRFVVQVGAYGDAATLREVRARVEKLGLKTYTQVVQTEGGPRTRVRVGPFGSRQEAEKAYDTLAAAGLRGNLLTL